MSDTNGVLHVGIDLGTSHSAISASNGTRHVVDSYVGWPVDMVARKVLKKSVLIGREALENRTMLDLRRPLERGLIKEGCWADVVVFDYDKIQDHATYEQPLRYPEGIEYVLVNGQVVIDQGKHTGARPGHVLYGPGRVGH